MNWGPSLAPDGQTLVYTFARPPEPGELVLANPDATCRRPLGGGPMHGYLAVWSPDGSRLAYIAQEGPDTDTAELAVIDADRSNPRRLTTNHACQYGASWSPDGRRLVFGSKQDGTWRVYVINADGSDPHPVAGTE
jgi:TolB protein